MVLYNVIIRVIDGDIVIEILNYSIPEYYIYGLTTIIIIQIGVIYMVAKKKGRPKKIKPIVEEVLSEIYICTTCGVPCSSTERLISHNLSVHNFQISDEDARIKTDYLSNDEFNNLTSDELTYDKKYTEEYGKIQDRIDSELTRPINSEPDEIVSNVDISKSKPAQIYQKAMTNMGTSKTNVPLNGFSTIDMEGEIINFTAQFTVLNTVENMEILSRIGGLKRV